MTFVKKIRRMDQFYHEQNKKNGEADDCIKEVYYYEDCASQSSKADEKIAEFDSEIPVERSSLSLGQRRNDASQLHIHGSLHTGE